ncbi:hypothetical protein INT47_005201 [Mucor saturninus]|uniref:Uncharacterized protein n=1 Tax=Mucor saturninus TaxID=64648 RepID=A0A8H7QE92_9FUNG|nr:hypothetical protein INT47_005201 [Mucor saturninus]
MSNQNKQHEDSSRFITDNWRSELNRSSSKLNCPCRGDKSDYVRLESLLRHAKKHHPEQRRITTSLSHDFQNFAEDNDNNNISAPLMAMDFIMENPSTHDVLVDEDLDSSDELLPGSAPFDIDDGGDDDLNLSQFEESESEEDESNDQFFEDYLQYTNVIRPFSSYIESAVTADSNESLPGIDQTRQALNNDSEELEPINDIGSSPYRNMVTFLLHVLFLGDEDLSSERSIKKIMYAMELLLENLVVEDGYPLIHTLFLYTLYQQYNYFNI